jgi:hypothetical protein
MQIAASLARKPEKKLSLMAKAGNSKIKDLTLVDPLMTPDFISDLIGITGSTIMKCVGWCEKKN